MKGPFESKRGGVWFFLLINILNAIFVSERRIRKNEDEPL